MLNIALPKGRLGDKVYGRLEKAGFACSEIKEESRKLVFENPSAGLRYMLVKPSDVAIYVAHGAADVGVVGKDILAEGHYDIYELLDLGFGRCHMCVAAKEDYREDPSRPVRVATKFPHIAKAYYRGLNREIEVIKLNGSIEIAPLLGLSDVIVDIVETGGTLKENHLKVFEKIMPISARFIANKASYRFKGTLIDAMAAKLQERDAQE
ncbi:MAG: ATP phosphoribosyltransferase [Clostridiales bacterium]|nr:ATP phosphoribosyltransferase [Clostridiales bacterium]